MRSAKTDSLLTSTLVPLPAGANVERDAEISVLRADFLQRSDAGEAGFVLELLVGFDDALDVVVGEEALGAFAGDFVDGVDEQDSAFARLGLGRAADDDAGFHRRVVEEVRPKAEDAFDEVGFDELAPHLRFFLAEENAVREEDGAAAGLGREAAQDVLPEGVVGAALRRRAVEVAAPRVGGEGVAVPLLDGIGRIGQHHVEAHEAVALQRTSARTSVSPRSM